MNANMHTKFKVWLTLSKKDGNPSKVKVIDQKDKRSLEISVYNDAEGDHSISEFALGNAVGALIGQLELEREVQDGERDLGSESMREGRLVDEPS